MTDLIPHHNSTDLAQQMDYAKAVSSAAMLPQAYRGKPADIMLAVGLGSAMGLSPAESLYRIDVIQGTPTAGAELIASNVRKAGHTLRVRVDEQNMSVTATVIRKDDPDFEHTVVRDMKWAQQMGLDKKDNYRKQPLVMLQWRAITAVARLAASEALYGVGHTADELADTRPAPAPQQSVSVASLTQQATPATETEPEPPAQTETLPMGDEQDGRYWRKRLFATLNERGITDADEQRQGIGHIVNREITSRSELTEDDAQKVVEHLKATVEEPS